MGQPAPHILFAIKLKGREGFTMQMSIKGHSGNLRYGALNAIRDPKVREFIIVDFTPVKASPIGELSANFDLVMGYAAEVV